MPPTTPLFEGNKEFRNNLNTKTLKDQAINQKPKFLVICCSDSRASIETVTNTKDPGIMFVVRSIGGYLTEEGLASVKYGIDHLKIRELIFLSHTECGAVKAAQDAIRRNISENAGIEDPLAEIVLKIASHVKKGHAEDKQINAAVLDNATAQVERITAFIKEDPELRSIAKTDLITIHHLNYDLSNATLSEVKRTPIKLE